MVCLMSKGALVLSQLKIVLLNPSLVESLSASFYPPFSLPKMASRKLYLIFNSPHYLFKKITHHVNQKFTFSRSYTKKITGSSMLTKRP